MDCTAVTETADSRVTREAFSMLYTRYRHAAQFCDGKEVLEVSCGAGQGLGYLAKRARRVVGGDCTGNLLIEARRACQGCIPLIHLDAHALPFRSSSFDVVLLFEAIYYLAHPERFFDECRRVLRENGLLLLCTVNKEWLDFNPSPMSIRYFSANELYELLVKHRFRVELHGGFRVMKQSARDAVVSLIKRTAVALHLIPRTMKGKEFLKRLFFGRLVWLPAEVKDGMAEYVPPVPLMPHSEASQYKVLYAVAYIA